MTDTPQSPGQSPPAAKSFDVALDELEATVRKLDSGELALEEALEVFERGVGLVRECQELLDEAERRIVELTETSQGIKESEHPGRGV